MIRTLTYKQHIVEVFTLFDDFAESIHLSKKCKNVDRKSMNTNAIRIDFHLIDGT